MKKLLIVFVALVFLVAGVVVALPNLVPMEKVEAEISSRFTKATGRTLTYDYARIYMWPNIGLRLRDVSVSNPDWATDKEMVKLEELDIAFALRPLFEKRIELKRFVLKSPVINLEKAADGRANWEMKPSAAAPAATDKKDGAGKADMGQYSFSLGEFNINNAALSFRDGKTGVVQKLEDVDLVLVMPSLGAPLNLDGALTYKGQRLNVVLGIDKPLDLADGKASSGSLNLKSDVISAEVAGNFATTGVLMKGQVNTDIPSLPKLAAWISGGAEAAMPVTKISAASGVEVSADQITLSGATLTLDDIKGGGELTVDLSGKRPAVKARLSVDTVNLDRFIKPSDAAAVAGPAKPVAADSDWDNSPIDFSGLKAVDADVIVQTKGFVLKGVELGASNLSTKLTNGNLVFSSSEATLFGGKVKSDINVNASSATPTLSAKLNLTGVEAKPVLTTFAGFKKLSGKGDMNLFVNGAGVSQRAIVKSLNGNGKMLFRDGSIEGIDLVNIAQMLQKRLTTMGVGGGKTDFVELGGTFTIVNGVANNQDLKMKGPLVQATGSGDVDLPKKEVRYRVVPILTASSAVEGASGIKVPVDIVGPFSAIKVRPDYGAVLKDALENPEEIKKTLKQAEDSIDPIKDNIKNIRKDLKDDPAKAIGNILGGGLLAPAPAPVEPVAPAPVEVAPAEAAPVEEAVPAEQPPAETAPPATP